MHDRHLVDCGFTHLFQALAQLRSCFLVEVIVLGFYPLLHHNAGEFFIIVIIGEQFARRRFYLQVNVGKDSILPGAKVLCHPADGSFYLLIGLWCCNHSIILQFYRFFPWQFLNFFPLPQGHGSLRPGSFSAVMG